MIVALSTGHGGAHPDGHGGVDAVHDRNVAKLFILGSAFVIGHGVAVEGCGDDLIFCRVGQQISG